MAWMMDTTRCTTGYTVTGVVTGKPVSIGGRQGRGGATSRGVAVITLTALRAARHGPASVTRRRAGLRQGRRARRRSTCTRPGAAVVAVSDVNGGGVQPAGPRPGALMARTCGRARLGRRRARHRRDHQRGAARARRRRAGARRAGGRDPRGQRRPACGRGSSSRAPTVRRPPTPTRCSPTAASGRARHPGQRRRRRGLLLRVGAGPAGVVLVRGRGQRTAVPPHGARVCRGARGASGGSLRTAAQMIGVGRVAEAHRTRGLYP